MSACTCRSALSGIPTSCAASPSGPPTWRSCSATCCGSLYGGADGRHAGRVLARARARPGVRRRRRAGLLGGYLRGRDAGRARPLRRRVAVRVLVGRRRPAGRASRDRVPRLLRRAGANGAGVVAGAGPRDRNLNPRRLAGFLVTGEAIRLPAVIVLNKIDLDRAALERLVARYAPAGYQVLATSVTHPVGLPALRDLLRGRESVLAGQSGVGKSSLLNALYPGLNLRIGEISEKWGTGRHTTRAALLVPLAGGGSGGDTPGLREGGTWGVDPGAPGP